MLTDESFIDFKCPHCGDSMSFPKDLAGQAQSCPTCMEDVIVPKDETATGLKLPFPMAMSTLVLRRLNGEDWQDLLEILADEDQFTYSEGRPLGEEEVMRWLESEQLVKITTPNQSFFLGMELEETGKLIGFVTLNFTDAQRLMATVSASVNQSFQRKGFATEALSAVLNFCFDGIGLHRVTASCDSRNIAGWRLLDTVGMRREGEFVKDRQVNGEWSNTVFYAMLEEEYNAEEEH